ncbi:MAG: dihydrodipicolinate synthase family protein [Rhodothermales bacterium]
MRLRERLLDGLVIPAHPLAINANRRLDARRQRALSRYYLAAGAGGLAVGVHTTQFEIHDENMGLYRPALELAADVAGEVSASPVLVAGLVGDTEQAVAEARLAKDLGYHCGLLSLSAFAEASEDAMIAHAADVADVLPVFGFYLQPAVGGRSLSYRFWRRFAEIEHVVAIKIAPFDRYRTIDVVRAVADSGRGREIALYTGNDDQIVLDLLTRFPYDDLYVAGGLLGHWAVWTRRAVELFERIRSVRDRDEIPADLLTRSVEVTEANAALFDPPNAFAGCIPGIHEVLRRQGLLEGVWTLNPDEALSPGQREEIDRIYHTYPHLTDDEFVREHIDEWLK